MASRRRSSGPKASAPPGLRQPAAIAAPSQPPMAALRCAVLGALLALVGRRWAWRRAALGLGLGPVWVWSSVGAGWELVWIWGWMWGWVGVWLWGWGWV